MRDVGVISTADAINWGFTGPDPALDRRAARPAQGHALPRLRRARLRRAGRHQGRQLRPLLRAHARDGRVGHMIRQLRGHAAGRADQRRRPPLHAPREALVYTRDRVADQPLQADHGRARRCPPARSTSRTRRANGELGFYLVSDGEARPYKVHVRSPSFVHMGGVHRCSRATSSPTSSRPSARST